MKRPRNRRLLMLRAIADHIERHGYPPTLRELGDAVGLASTTTVIYHLGQLADLGRIDYHPHRARGVQLLLTPGVVTVPVAPCVPCGGDMPWDHVCRAVAGTP